MEDDISVLVRVLETQVVDERTVAIVQLVRGNVKVGLQLRSESTGSRWRVIGVGFIPQDAWSQGRRAISIKPLADIQRMLTVGDCLSSI